MTRLQIIEAQEAYIDWARSLRGHKRAEAQRLGLLKWLPVQADDAKAGRRADAEEEAREASKQERAEFEFAMLQGDVSMPDIKDSICDLIADDLCEMRKLLGDVDLGRWKQFVSTASKLVSKRVERDPNAGLDHQELIARVVQTVSGHSNPALIAEALLICTGRSGKSGAAVGKAHRTSRATVSAICVHLCAAFGLPIPRGMRQKKVVEAYTERAHRVHAKRKAEQPELHPDFKRKITIR